MGGGARAPQGPSLASGLKERQRHLVEHLDNMKEINKELRVEMERKEKDDYKVKRKVRQKEVVNTKSDQKTAIKTMTMEMTLAKKEKVIVM